MLELNNIEVVYNHVILVLKGISLTVPESGIVALLGANGAGKTTTLKAISGMLRSENGELTEGSIRFMGAEINNKDADEVVHLGICLVPEGRQVFGDLNVSENLWVGAHIRKDIKAVKKDFELILKSFPILNHRQKQQALFLSGGEQQMLVIGRALMSRPKLMMLDEPSLGLAPMVIKENFKILEKINRELRTGILLVEQNARIGLNFAQYGYIMENGKIMLDGPTDKLKQNEDVKEFYLGVSAESHKKSYSNIKHYKRRKRWLS